MNIITLFSGIGFQERAIQNLKISHNIIYWAEYKKSIARCFEVLHNPSPNTNLKDVTKIDTSKLVLPKTGIDIVISSFPCQSFSNAGKQKGFEDEKNGNLFYAGLKLINFVRPKVVIYENVKNITAEKFDAIHKITGEMDKSGYVCFHQILNSKDYGIPQNRERWFMVCIRKDLGISNFEFPKPIPLKKCVGDYLEKKDVKRSISNDMKQYLENIEEYKSDFKSRNGLIKVFDGVGQNYFKSGFTTHRIYSVKGVCPTFTTSNDCHFMEIKGKLTAKERFMLMGMKSRDYDLLKDKGVSDRTIDFVSGNGIVVDVFQNLFREIFSQVFK